MNLSRTILKAFCRTKYVSTETSCDSLKFIKTTLACNLVVMSKVIYHLIFFLKGPDFWGRLNPKWILCAKGRRQSPINIEPDILLFDPLLPALDLIGQEVSILLQMIFVIYC